MKGCLGSLLVWLGLGSIAATGLIPGARNEPLEVKLWAFGFGVVMVAVGAVLRRAASPAGDPTAAGRGRVEGPSWLAVVAAAVLLMSATAVVLYFQMPAGGTAAPERTRPYWSAVEAVRKRVPAVPRKTKDETAALYITLATELERLPTAGVSSEATDFAARTAAWLRAGADLALNPKAPDHADRQRQWADEGKRLDAEQAELRGKLAAPAQ